MSKNRIIYIHGGGDIIGGIEIFLKSSMNYHEKYEPYLAIVRKGKYYEYIKECGFQHIVCLGGGRIRNIPGLVKSVIEGVIFVIKNDIKIVIAHGSHSWIFAALIAKLSFRKSIHYVHGIVDPDKLSIIDKIGFKLHPDMYVANSIITRDSLSKIYHGHIYVNYPSSDLCLRNALHSDTEINKLRISYNFPANKIIFTVLGRIQKGKGQDLAVRAFLSMENIDKCMLLIVGDYSFEKDRDYYKYIREISKECSFIKFIGFTKNVELFILYSDYILIPSVEPESFGLTAIEAMSCGKVVIASAHGGILEIIKNKYNGLLFEKDNYKNLADIMDMVVNNNNLCNEIRSNAKADYDEKFSIDKSIQNLEEIIS